MMKYFGDQKLWHESYVVVCNPHDSTIVFYIFDITLYYSWLDWHFEHYNDLKLLSVSC